MSLTSAPPTTGATPGKYFFISRAGADREVGKQICEWLEQAGNRVFIQDWDIEPGQNFLVQIHDALAEGAHVLALLSDPYFASEYCKQEWTAAIKEQERTGKVCLTPFKIRPCTPTGLLGAVVYVDLSTLQSETARRAVLSTVAALDGTARSGGSWIIPSPLDRPRFTNLEAFDDDTFVGRTDELKLIHDSLGDEASKRVAVTALAGLGGVGKSALARAYCEHHLKDYEVIWWLRAEDEQDLESDLAQLALAWNPANSRIADRRERALEAVRIASNWAATRPFLLVFDNAQTPSDVRPFRPTGTCRTLITSRHTSWGREWRQMMVRKFDPDTAARLMMKATNRSDYVGARALAVELDGLALPLTHAAAFLRENPATSFQDFVRRFDELMQWQTDDVDVRTTFATYSMAIDKVASPLPAARAVMAVAAYWAPNIIPFTLIQTALALARPPNTAHAPPTSEGSDRIKDAISALSRYALVDIDTGGSSALSVSLHRVLQRVVRKIHADHNEVDIWGCAALRAIEQQAPELKDEAARHGKEALAVVPEDACRGTYGSLRSLFADEIDDDSVDRARELERLNRLLSERGQNRVALVGEGGSGKTTLARLYVDRYRTSYDVIWWISASDEHRLLSGFLDVLQKLGPSIPATSDAVRAAVSNVAESHSRKRPLLIVFDDAMDPASIRNWVPRGNVRVLLTSRFRDWEPFAIVMSLRSFEPEEATEFLLRQTGQQDLEGARVLAQLLEGSPLALSIASLLLKRDPTLSFTSLIQQLQSDPVAMGERWERKTQTLLQHSLRDVRLRDPAADVLLSLISFCGAEDIPVQLIANACAHLHLNDRGLISEERLTIAITNLASLGLITKMSDEAGEVLSAHRLILDATRMALPPEEQALFGNAALLGAIAAFPDPQDEKSGVLAERIARHGMAILSVLPDAEPNARSQLLALIATRNVLQGEYMAAEGLFRQALEINRQTSDGSSRSLPQIRLALADLYRRQDRLVDAREAAQSAILEIERLGDKVALADGLNLLVEIYQRQGDYSAALPLLEQTLRLSNELQNVGARAYALSNLGQVYLQTARYDDAEPAFLKALELYQNLADFPQVGKSLNILSLIYQRTGRIAEAAEALKRSVDTTQRALGPDHPDLIASLNNLAVLYANEGRTADAEPLMRRALSIAEQSLGTDHPSIAENLRDLAAVCVARNQTQEAELLLKRALDIHRRTPEASKVDTLLTLLALIRLYAGLDRIFDQQPLLRQAIAIIETPEYESSQSRDLLATDVYLLQATTALILGNPPEALAWCGKARALLEAKPEIDPRRLASTREKIAQLEADIRRSTRRRGSVLFIALLFVIAAGICGWLIFGADALASILSWLVSLRPQI